MLGHGGEEISDDENRIYTWYYAKTRDSSSISAQSSDKDTSTDLNSSKFDFKLGIDIVHCNGKGNRVAVVYKGASAKGLLHTIRL